MSVGLDKVAPFVGGYVTDREPWELKPNESPLLQDAVFTGEVAGLRGAWSYSRAAAPGSPAMLLATEDHGLYASGSLVGAGAPGTTAGLATVSPVDGVFPFDVASFDGETIFAYGFGSKATGAVVRYSGHVGALTFNGTGQASVIANSPVVTFASASALPPVGSYIGIGGVNGTLPMFRVVSVDTGNSLVAVDFPFPFTSTGQAWTQSSIGFVGLGTVVTDQGDATFPSTVGAYVTGRGTDWTGWTYAPTGGDLIGARGSWPGGSFVGLIPNESQLSIENSTQVATNVAYAIVRPLCGAVVAAHRNRLWAAAPPWNRNLLQWTVAEASGVSLSRMFNGIDSPTLDYLDARIADNVQVPSKTAPGSITGLCSVPAGVLLVLRTNNAYRVAGEPPALSIDLLHPEAGCYGPECAFVGEDGAYWFGPAGVWYSNGGVPQNLSDDAVGRELQAAGGGVSLGVVDGHLRLCVTGGVTYWYDIRGKRWCGKHTGQTAISQQPTTDGDVIWVPSGATRPALSRSIITAETTVSADDPGGTFIARTPSTRGDGTTGLIRPTQLTVAADVAGSGVALDVHAGSSQVTDGQVGQIAASPSGEVTVKRIGPAATGALGCLVRDFYVELRQDAAAVPSRLRVHQVDIRERRRRSKA